ncbi:hypothetical protein HHK36_019534 [Tetracentron sinense]|uniref:Uncharacterized protein n=1 Tax=Tetracentron sinense TaxID=13715 RepID=A0A835DCU9_TETSI|nr:hypothetical protein HHK36_019534 [Tetracentron sinense]
MRASFIGPRSCWHFPFVQCFVPSTSRGSGMEIQQLISIIFISHISNPSVQQPSPTVDYLVNSCGLSQESALRAAQQIDIKTTNKSDSVLELLRNYGFTNTHIVKLITNRPSLLMADPIKTLKPKMEFFRNNGISDPILAKFLSADTSVFGSSLEKDIIPSFNYLKSFLRTNDNIAIALGRRWILRRLSQQNISLLQNHGVPESTISKIIMLNPRTLCFKPDKFREVVMKIIEMGFDSSSLMFAHGLIKLLAMNKGTWEAKLAVYRSFGWSDAEILSMFRKQPNCMGSSEKKISTALDFFMKKLNWTRAYISKYPTTLFLSLEKRTMPRCSVVEVLLSKGLMRKENMGTALLVAEDEFLKNYVVKYQEDLPQLLTIYQSKMGVL